MIRYRIKAYSRIERQPRGYIGTHRVHYQELQRKRWWGWQTIGREEVPNWAVIYLGAYGDTGGWVSKFASFGSWGRDGVVTPHEVEKVLDRIGHPA
jgi:hypothetical protein